MIPIYYLTLNPEDKINFVSIVENPASGSFFEKFSEPMKEQFSLDTEKQIITGLIMSPDTPIYRKRGDHEYYVAFNEDAIREIAKKIIDNPKAAEEPWATYSVRWLWLRRYDGGHGTEWTQIPCTPISEILLFPMG